MRKTRGALQRWLFAAAIISTSTAMSVLPNPIMERDDTCPVPGYSKCSGTGLPGNFCCKSGNSCVALAGDTTVLCCPGGANACDAVQTISCDVSLQDAAAHPDAQVKTTALTIKLPSCGDNCCPFGFSCVSESGKFHCQKDADQSKKPSNAAKPTITPGAASATGTKATSTSGANSASSAGTTAASGNAPASSDTQEPTSNDNAAVIGGAVGGIVFVIFVGVGVCIFKHFRKQEDKKRPDSNSSFSCRGRTPNLAGYKISNPKPQGGDLFQQSGFLQPRPSPQPQGLGIDFEKYDNIDLNNDDTLRPCHNPFRDPEVPPSPASAKVAPLRKFRSSRQSHQPSDGSVEIPIYARESTIKSSNMSLPNDSSSLIVNARLYNGNFRDTRWTDMMARSAEELQPPTFQGGSDNRI